MEEVDDLGKNVDDHGTSCLGGPSEPSMLAGVVGPVVSRPAVESDCEIESKGSSARYTNMTDGASCLVGPSAPGMLEGVDGRVGKAFARAGTRDLLLDTRTEVAQYSYCPCWKRR